MFEQDYIMRMIKDFIKVIVKVVFKTDIKIEDEEKVQELCSDKDLPVYKQLINMVEQGEMNEAENLLYEKMDINQISDMQIAVAFYSYLNEFEDSYLKACNYSRQEVLDGLKNVIKQFGVDIGNSLFLGEN